MPKDNYRTVVESPVSSVPPRRETLVGGYRASSHVRLQTPRAFSVVVLQDEDLRSAYEEVLEGRAKEIVACGFDDLEETVHRVAPRVLVATEALHRYGAQFLEKVCTENSVRLAVHRAVAYPQLVDMVFHYMTSAYPELFTYVNTEIESA